MKYTSSQKLWRVIKDKYDYYYEIRVAGTTIDRIKIDEPALKFLKSEGIIDEDYEDERVNYQSY